MILQCMKCDLYYRSFARIRIHKALQCRGDIRDDVNASEADLKQESDEPWSYNLDPVKTEEGSNNNISEKEEYFEKDVKIKPESSHVKNEKVKEEGDADVEGNKDSSRIKQENDIRVKPEPVDNIKSEPRLDAEGEGREGDSGRRDPYADGVYRPAPVMVDSDSEYEAESDDSAPDDDDIESHLGMLTKWNPHRDEKQKSRKRKRDIPENARVVFMVSASGQQIKKIKMTPKDTTRWVPPHPWVPYPNQVTVEQCCLYLELKDYPILVNTELQEKFKNKAVFDEYALPLLKTANPSAHPLTLSTLLRAKWFEVMNTETLEAAEGEDNSNS